MQKMLIVFSEVSLSGKKNDQKWSTNMLQNPETKQFLKKWHAVCNLTCRNVITVCYNNITDIADTSCICGVHKLKKTWVEQVTINVQAQYQVFRGPRGEKSISSRQPLSITPTLS